MNIKEARKAGCDISALNEDLMRNSKIEACGFPFCLKEWCRYYEEDYDEGKDREKY